MLLRKDVLKLIRNLKSGQYRKGKGELVNSKGTHFCCLGVWADQHGCTWDEVSTWESKSPELLPVANGKTKPAKKQTSTHLARGVAFGLTAPMQGALIRLNDGNKTWDSVIAYLKTKVLPKAK